MYSFGQVKRCCDTYVYEGYIQVEPDKKLGINLNFLILLDSTMVGSYYYKPNRGSLKVVGKFNRDFTFTLFERDTKDSLTGIFEGNLNKDFKFASGKWTDGTKKKAFDFEIKQVVGKSYWDYIKKNRALFEYKNLNQAIRSERNVLSIDMSNKGVDTLPDELSRLDRIVSINLLGNEFQSFPIVLSKLVTLDEISLSSNQLMNVGPEIGRLKNLRILIMNNNKIKQLPKEIGELANLLYLELGNNLLTRLPEELKFLTSLQELHIERNRLDEIEKQRLKKMLPNCIIHF
jgi:hypothetical protein